jgi:hypothetical protein
VALVTAGCASAQTAGSVDTNRTPSTIETRHVVADPIELDVPATWQVRSAERNPGGNMSIAFLSPQALVSSCAESAQGGVCRAWPFMHVEPGSIVIAVRLYGRPGSKPSTGGEPITVAGSPATRRNGPADPSCQAMGGSTSTDVVVPTAPGSAGWLSLDACLAGPDTSAAEATFSAIVATVKASDGTASQ